MSILYDSSAELDNHLSVHYCKGIRCITRRWRSKFESGHNLSWSEREIIARDSDSTRQLRGGDSERGFWHFGILTESFRQTLCEASSYNSCLDVPSSWKVWLKFIGEVDWRSKRQPGGRGG